MRRNFTRTYTEYKQSIDMDSPLLKDISLVVNVYRKIGDLYTLEGSMRREINATSIVCSVLLEYVPDTGMYSTNKEEIVK